MADFTAKFDAYIERGRKRVLEDRNSFRAKLSELHGRHDAILETASLLTQEQKSKNPRKLRSARSKHH